MLFKKDNSTNSLLISFSLILKYIHCLHRWVDVHMFAQSHSNHMAVIGQWDKLHELFICCLLLTLSTVIPFNLSFFLSYLLSLSIMWQWHSRERCEARHTHIHAGSVKKTLFGGAKLSLFIHSSTACCAALWILLLVGCG